MERTDHICSGATQDIFNTKNMECTSIVEKMLVNFKP